MYRLQIVSSTIFVCILSRSRVMTLSAFAFHERLNTLRRLNFFFFFFPFQVCLRLADGVWPLVNNINYTSQFASHRISADGTSYSFAAEWWNGPKWIIRFPWNPEKPSVIRIFLLCAFLFIILSNVPSRYIKFSLMDLEYLKKDYHIPCVFRYKSN